MLCPKPASRIELFLLRCPRDSHQPKLFRAIPSLAIGSGAIHGGDIRRCMHYDGTRRRPAKHPKRLPSNHRYLPLRAYEFKRLVVTKFARCCALESRSHWTYQSTREFDNAETCVIPAYYASYQDLGHLQLDVAPSGLCQLVLTAFNSIKSSPQHPDSPMQQPLCRLYALPTMICVFMNIEMTGPTHLGPPRHL